jgi:flagellar motor switch/type III secretory pathway protein FliN
VSTSPDPALPPTPTLDAAVAAVTGAVTLARLTAGALATGEDALDRPPAGLPVVLALTLTGHLEGTVTLAVNDELADRLEYAASASGTAEALAPVAAALVAALARSGPVDATPLVEVEADAWPAGPGVSTAILTMAPEDDADGSEGEGETPEPGLALAFALTVAPAEEEDLTDGSVSGTGQSSLSTSAPAGITSYVPSANRPGGAPLTPEGRRLGAVEVDVAGVLGETTVALHELLTWLPGVIVSLHRDVGMPVDVRIDDATVAHAEIVVVDERYALRVLDVEARAQARVAADRTSDMRGDSSP